MRQALYWAEALGRQPCYSAGGYRQQSIESGDLDRRHSRMLLYKYSLVNLFSLPAASSGGGSQHLCTVPWVWLGIADKRPETSSMIHIW